MPVQKTKLGKVHVFTGHGKGKTSAAIGVAVRAAGHDLKVRFIQFMKQGYTGERFIFDKITNIKFSAFGSRCKNWETHEEEIRKGTFEGFCRDCFKPYAEDLPMCQKGLLEAKKCSSSGRWDVVILDELTIAIKYKYLQVQDALDLIREKHPNTELVFSGRFAPQELKDAADLVTTMQPTKHYFNKGLDARKGIEF